MYTLDKFVVLWHISTCYEKMELTNKLVKYLQMSHTLDCWVKKMNLRFSITSGSYDYTAYSTMHLGGCIISMVLTEVTLIVSRLLLV